MTRKRTLPYRNHNTAYYPWIEKQIGSRCRILDVGCGDGSLVYWLSGAGEREICGLEPSDSCLASARKLCTGRKGIRWICGTFEETSFENEQFDVVIFSASLHHMEQETALRKAVTLLREGGILLVVGIAAPSWLWDYLMDALRVVPNLIVSKFLKMTNTEERGIPVSYEFPAMSNVRAVAKTVLPGCKIRYGLHYRYLLRYEKRTT